MSNNTNGYAAYLEEQQKATAQPSATPAAQGSTSGYGQYLTGLQPTPTTSVGADYAGFLQTIANNKKIENTPTNAKTYADYLTYIGQDPVGEYQAKVRQANLDYAKGLATYGQAAEKMAKSGLLGSGYGEYLQGVAYQGRQSAVGAAQKEAQAAMKQTFANYSDYLTGVKGTNEQNAITGIVNGLLEGDAAREYARGLGVTEDRLDYVLQQTSGSVSAAKAQKAQQQQALLADAMSSATTLVTSGQTVDAAIASLSGVYDSAVLAQVKQNLQASTKAQNTANMNTATGVSNYKATLDSQLREGTITKPEYDAWLTAGYEKNYEYIQKALGGDASGLADYALAAELDISEGSAEQISAVIDHMANSGVISNEYRQRYYIDLEMQSIENDNYSAKDAVNEAETIHTLFNDGKINEAQRNQLLQKLGDCVGNAYGRVGGSKKGTEGQNPLTDAHFVTIFYKQGDFGNEAINITYENCSIVDGSDFVRGKQAQVNGKPFVFGTINGRAAYYYLGQYYQAPSGTPEYTNTEQNAAFISYMIAPE